MEKAVVGSDVGGIAELVENGKTGLLFESGNPEKLTDALVYLLNNPAERESFGLRGRQMVSEKRDWRIIARNYTDLYNSLLKSSPK
jgi:glycosyltransferase involved in cell wall biosynthesis